MASKFKYNGVNAEEMEDSPHVSQSGGVMQATRKFRVAWKDAFKFADGLVGTGISAGTLPIAKFPSNSGLVACDFAIDPASPKSPNASTSGAPANPVTDINTGTNYYEAALVTVSYQQYLSEAPFSYYGPKMPSVPTGTFLTYTSDMGCQYLSLPGRNLVWATDGISVDNDARAGILLPAEDFVFHWHRVPKPPFLAFDKCRGCVNISPFMGYIAESVMLTSIKPRPVLTPKGAILWNLEMHFKARSSPDFAAGLSWNFAFRNSAGTFQGMKAKGTGGAKPFTPVDFNQLFVAGT